MAEQVTIVVVPRDRLSSLALSVEAILQHTAVPFRLAILDLGYRKADLEHVRRLAASVPCDVVAMERTIPMIAFQQYLPRITTPYTAWVDNDTFVTAGWMKTMLTRAAAGARVILPVTFEREGLDLDRRRLPLRNHVSHTEFRRVAVDGKTYVFDHKPFRRAAPEELPQEPHMVDFFELHAFFAETVVLRQLDYPSMVVREHIDLGVQLNRLGIPIWAEPKAHVVFDNIHERPTREDLRFFFFRWQDRLIDESHDLFEKRWGQRFYNEQFLKNWAFRRRVFSVGRYLGVPYRIADLASKVMVRLLRPPIPRELRSDPLARSERVLPPPVAA